MAYRKVLSAITFCMLAVGCASNFEDRMVKDKDYSGAFYSVSMYRFPVSQDVLSRVASRIKDAAGPGGQKEFLAQTLKSMKHTGKTDEYFLSMRIYVDQAEQAGLLSPEDASVVERELYIELARQVALAPGKLNSTVAKTYPKLAQYEDHARDLEFQRAIIGQLPDLDSYTGLYRSLGANSARAGELLPFLRNKTKSVAAESGSVSQLSSLVSAYSATGDQEIKSTVQSYIKNARLSKGQLESLSQGDFADAARIELSKREVHIKIDTDSTDPFVDELAEVLPKVSEWITLDERADRKLTINRLRFTEREASPSIRTQTLSQLDFATVLLIPKNASVLFDYSIIKYEINWSMSVRDSVSKRAKVISGKKQTERIECSNFRYKNVFGGEGALSFVPAGASGFCSQSSSVSFERFREQVIGEISREVAEFIESNLATKT